MSLTTPDNKANESTKKRSLMGAGKPDPEQKHRPLWGGLGGIDQYIMGVIKKTGEEAGHEGT